MISLMMQCNRQRRMDVRDIYLMSGIMVADFMIQ